MRSFLELAILGLLNDQPSSGYDLRRVFASTPMGHFSDSPGAIYPAVRRLIGRGLVRSVSERGSARGREVLHLTREGRAELRQALTAPLDEQEVLRYPDHQMLRFAFLLVAGNHQAAAALLKSYAEITGHHASNLAKHRKEMLRDGKPEVVLPLEQGIILYRARSRWARASARRLEAQQKAVNRSSTVDPGTRTP